MTYDLIELKESAQVKDQHLEKKNRQLDESTSQISNLEETNFEAFDEINKLRADVKFIE